VGAHSRVGLMVDPHGLEVLTPLDLTSTPLTGFWKKIKLKLIVIRKTSIRNLRSSSFL
jgi:hypothetical protein